MNINRNKTCSNQLTMNRNIICSNQLTMNGNIIGLNQLTMNGNIICLSQYVSRANEPVPEFLFKMMTLGNLLHTQNNESVIYEKSPQYCSVGC